MKFFYVLQLSLLFIFLFEGSSMGGLILPAYSAVVEEENGQRALKQKLMYLEKMIFSSTISQRVNSSGKPEAIALLNEVQNNFNQANEMFTAGELEKANELISKSYTMAGKLSQMVADKKNQQQKDQAQFEGLHKQSHSYLKTLDALASEEESLSGYLPDKSIITAQIHEAAEFANKGDFKHANDAMMGIVSLLEQSLVAARDSMTLISRFEFGSLAEEYSYEIESFKSHQMLVDLMIRERKPSLALKKLIDDRVAKSQDLKDKAESSAKLDKYGDSISLMEQAIKELVRALRIGGLNIQ
ncbi:MAG TPA: hypothetical protein ENG96_06955 [Gammaproteobacteria bacterium]|nr:hypothetical protein [Gammaproteobacteria bacterium]